jgi:predicted secreted protein
MGALSVILVFVIFWWIAWFITLPFGIKTAENPEPGHTPSAPVKPRLWKKAAIATGVSAVITGAIVAIVEAGWLSFQDFAE